MPCYDTGSALGDAQLEASETHERLTRVTRIACELSQVIPLSTLKTMSEEAQKWVRDHRETDKKNKTLKKKKNP